MSDVTETNMEFYMRQMSRERCKGKQFSVIQYRLFGLVWFAGFYGISTFLGYLTPNPFLYN